MKQKSCYIFSHPSQVWYSVCESARRQRCSCQSWQMEATESFTFNASKNAEPWWDPLLCHTWWQCTSPEYMWCDDVLPHRLCSMAATSNTKFGFSPIYKLISDVLNQIWRNMDMQYAIHLSNMRRCRLNIISQMKWLISLRNRIFKVFTRWFCDN